MAEEAYSLTEEARSLLDRAADALATEPAPTPEDKPFPGRIVGGATLADRLRAKEAQEIASKFDTRAALEQARKDRATMPAPAERPVEQHFEKHLQTYAEKHHAALVRQLAGALLEARNKLATTPAPAPEGEPTTGQLLMGLAIIRELTGTQQQDLKATIEAVRKALAATPALANNADTERLDYLQKGGVTLHLVPDHEDPGNAFAYKFCVGGLWKATSRDLREAIDTSKAMQKANQNG